MASKHYVETRKILTGIIIHNTDMFRRNVIAKRVSNNNSVLFNDKLQSYKRAQIIQTDVEMKEG